MHPDYVINPETNRIIKKGTPKYRRLVKLGLVTPGAVVTPPADPVPSPAVEPTVEPTAPKQRLPQKARPAPSAHPELPRPEVLKRGLKKCLKEVVKENKPAFKREMTQAESDRLLKTLLFTKLGLRSAAALRTAAAPRIKKKKVRIQAPPPSDSESGSDSD